MKLSITLLFLFLSCSSFSQNAYYNAKTVGQISSAEVAKWVLPAPNNLIQAYMNHGLLSNDIDTSQLNDFDELLTFMKTPFDSVINNELLLYQIGIYKKVKLAIKENRDKKIKFFNEVPNLDTTMKVMVGTDTINCKDLNHISTAIHNKDRITYQELCGCLTKSSIKRIVPNFTGKNSPQNGGDRRNTSGVDLNSILGIFSNVSGASFTSMLVDATAQFLVERTQKELSIAFFDRFKKEMAQFPEIKALFPSTYSLLEGLIEFREPSVGKVWVESFSADITGFPKHFENFVLQSDKEPYTTLRKIPEFAYTRLAYHTAEKIMEGTNAADLIAYLNTFYATLDLGDTMIQKALEVTFALSRSVRCLDGSRNNSSKQIWIHPSAFIQMNFKTQKYFLGLLYQENKKLIASIPLFDFKNDQTIKRALMEFNSFLVVCENIQNQHLKLAKILQSSEQTRADHLSAYLDYTEVAFQVIDFGFNLVPIKGADYNQILKPLMGDVLNILRGINEKNYAQITSYSLKIINELVAVGLEKGILNTNDIDSIQRVKEIQEALKQISFYGNFIVDIVSADSTSKMKRILNKYAAPIGSYKIKRQTLFSVDLNAYPGLYTGFELTPEATKVSNQSGFAYGVTAPIGFSLNWGSRKIRGVSNGSELGRNYYQAPDSTKWKEVTGASNSIFISIIDIGGAFSYRWNGTNETDGFPDSLKFDQIFSPGLYYVHGFKNAPISLMLGVQYTPLLRSIRQGGTGAVINEFNAIRFGASFVVDIPIFNLYRRKNRTARQAPNKKRKTKTK